MLFFLEASNPQASAAGMLKLDLQSVGIQLEIIRN